MKSPNVWVEEITLEIPLINSRILKSQFKHTTRFRVSPSMGAISGVSDSPPVCGILYTGCMTEDIILRSVLREERGGWLRLECQITAFHTTLKIARARYTRD